MTLPVLSALDYYTANSAALFPTRAGSKVPVGIVSSFVTDCSRDPAQWQAWSDANPGCNFGVVAGASGWIIVDIDVKQGRDAAWKAWCQLCAMWNVPVQMPHVATPSGGWHVYFRTDADPATLRQPDAIKGVINVRAGNGFTVAAGSTVNDIPYILLSDAAPYPAPDALVQHCTRATAPSTATKPTGTLELGDVAALVAWLTERDSFSAYEDWVSIGMALKLEFGDAGYDIWTTTTWPDALGDAPSKWASFATDGNGNSVMLQTWFKRANDLGWRGSVRKSTSAMFGQVAAIAAAAGAALPTGDQPMPMVAGQQVLTDIGRPICSEFLSVTSDAPTRPAAVDYPRLPATISGHGLFALLNSVVDRIVALMEPDSPPWKPNRIIQVAALLSLVYDDTATALGRRAEVSGCAWPWKKIKLARAEISDRVEREFVDQGDWHYDLKGQIEADNSDNVSVFLGILGCDLRWNGWLERPEIRGFNWADWTPVDDSIVAILRTRGNRTKTRFRAGKEFFWDSILSLAKANHVDPTIDRVAALQVAWDGTPRLSTWLTYACGTACDLYHQAVSRNIIGGMIRRIREPGCKHDLMPIFFGYQGSGKSTLAAILADMGQSSLVDLTRGEYQNFTDAIEFGEDAKELVLGLAGISVAEISEMGTRGSANVNHVKAMVSRQVDRGRTAYARTVTARPRRNIFIGTTNDDEPLTDPTGNRRFLPIRIEREIDLMWLHKNIGQLVGEAAKLHAEGATFDLPRSVWGIASEYQESARSASDLEIQFYAWFSPTPFTEIAFVTADDLVKACKRAGLRAGPGARSAIMKRLNFRQEKPYINGKRTAVWFRGPTSMLPAEILSKAVRYGVGADVHGDVKITIGK